MAGNPTDSEQAVWDGRAAARAIDTAREELAAILVLMLRSALGSCSAAFGRVIESLPTADQQARFSIEKIVEWMDWASVEIQRLRSENWQLAKTVSALDLRVEQSEDDRNGSGRVAHAEGPGGGSEGCPAE